MGVLGCDRKWCGNIMCNRYSYKYGYICDECFDDLVKLTMVNGSIDIEEFMRSTKNSFYFTTYDDAYLDISNIFLDVLGE